MFRLGTRTFATTARRAAQTIAEMEAPNSYGIGVSKAQGVVKGLTGGKHAPLFIFVEDGGLTGMISNWKYAADTIKSHL